ncbi:MAG: ethanolamine utilization protein EutJ [Ruminococcaceae bacterium]|nr:ethanolamine utilization protein EutJ [Oscillospiraceae bacterium]
MFKYCDSLVNQFEKVIEHPIIQKSSVYYTGIDLGTACVVMAVLNENYEPVAGVYKYADVVRDGMVVDYLGAIKIVREMKEKIEKKLGTKLVYAAAALPPGMEDLDGGAVRNIVEAADFEVTAMLDEPTAANKLLKLSDGAIVDIGGGTTGISVFKNGQVEMIDDEPTGGTHFSLVLAGSYQMKYEEAEEYKRNFSHHKEIYPVVKPVMEKLAVIITDMLKDHPVERLVLVGGSSCFTGIEKTIEELTGISTYKPNNPLFVTPLGIALSCKGDVCL